MSKILKNTTISDIELKELAVTIPASGQLDVEVADFLLLASEASVTELDTLIDSGDIVVNDGVKDLTADQAKNWIRYQDNFKSKFEIFVDPNGSNLTGDGSFGNPFADLTGALAAINAGDFPDQADVQISINIAAGRYDQDPVDFSGIVSEIVLTGRGPKTRLDATNPNADLVVLGNNHTVIAVGFGGVTNNNNYNLAWRTTVGGLGSAFNIRIQGGANGVGVFNDSGILRVTLNSPLLGVCTNALIEANDNTVVTLNGVVGLGNGTTTKGIVQNGNSDILLFGGRFTRCDAIITVLGNTGSVLLSGISGPGANRALDQTGSSTITILGGNFDVRSSNITDTSVIEGYYFQETPEENQLITISELAVGLPNKGRDSSFGEGDSYTAGMLVYTFDGSTYTNVSTNAEEINGSNFSFPNNNVNSAVYVSTAFDLTSPLTFPGIKLIIEGAAALGSGDIVFEYWNGSSWVEFNHMVANAEAPHSTFANSKLEQVGAFNYYFDKRIIPLWQTNDPISLGVNLHWMRMRIDGASITTSPIIDQVKIHSNSFKVEEDGFQVFLGNSRIVEKFPISFGGLLPVPSRGPNDSDFYLSDDLGIAGVRNSFPTNQDRSIGFNQFIPFELDTSCPLEVNISYFGDSNTAGVVQWELQWASSDELSSIFDSTAGAPASAPTQRTTTVTDSIPTSGGFQDRILTFRLEIPEAITQQTDGAPRSKIWLKLSRNVSGPDTYGGNIILTDFSLYYTAWREGGFSGSFT